jgi:hypothetical protein
MEVEKTKLEVGELHISGTDPEFLLFNSNTGAYHTRFVNWCKETVTRGYLFELIDKMLSAQAAAMLTENSDVQFHRGQAQALLKLKEIITRKATVQSPVVDKKTQE